MKSVFILLVAGFASLLVGCSSTPVVLAPVGPNPVGSESMASMGALQVFSSLVGQSEGDNPTWYQHTDYPIYDLRGKRLKHVDNTVGYYEQAPRRVALPTGRFLVKAQAHDYSWVVAPVLIQNGRTTRVHLDDHWTLPANAPKRELVSMPNGDPVGWRAGSTNAIGIN
jgi:hypothetical protein